MQGNFRNERYWNENSDNEGFGNRNCGYNKWENDKSDNLENEKSDNVKNDKSDKLENESENENTSTGSNTTWEVK